MFKSIKHTKVSDEIVNQIKNQISKGMLKPGDRLPPERELVKEFGVSRPSLREALNTLVAIGFLEVKGKRTFIKSVASESMQDPLSLTHQDRYPEDLRPDRGEKSFRGLGCFSCCPEGYRRGH